MADSLAGFVAKTEKMAAELAKLQTTTVTVAALAVKTSVLAQLQAAGVNSGRLRGVGKKGGPVGVSVAVTGHSAIVAATGNAFVLIESDTKAHRIGQPVSQFGLPFVDASGQDIRRRYVVIPGVGVRAYANHPGTKGKHPWAKGVAAAIPLAEKAQQVALTEALAKVYG